MYDDLYVENPDTTDRKGPFADMDEAREAAQRWVDAGDDVVIHNVLDGEILGSWEYDGEDLVETSDYEGDVWDEQERDEIPDEDPED